MGGAQSNTVGRVSAAVRPQYFHDFYFGRLYGEVMFEYSHQSRIDNYVIGCGTTLDARNLWVTIGYYHHREDLLFGGVRYTVIGAIRDDIQEPEYLIIHISNSGVEYQWEYIK